MYYDSTWVDVGGGDSGTSAGSVNGIVKSDGAGNFSAAVAGTDYLTSANFTGANQDLVGNGFQKLPGGLIIQWGTIMVAYGTLASGVLPMQFPTGGVILATSAPNTPPQTSALIFVQANIPNTTSFNVVSYHISGSTGSNAVFWIAIGY
jgi:hypothetical protein